MIALCAGLLASALGAAPDLEPEHTGNPIYKALVTEGLELAGATVPFPPPLLRDGQAPEAQYAALRSVAKSKGKADEMLRNAVTAPSVLKIRDLPARDGVVLRGTDVLFVIHGDLDVLDPTGAVLSSGELVEAEKIAFEAKPIPRDDLERRELALIKPSFGRFPVEWYLHATGRLFDHLRVETTGRVVATRSADSIVIAAQTAPGFPVDDPYPNAWWPLHPPEAHAGEAEPRQLYAGGGGYLKISRLTFRPGALLVEAHLIFAEPHAWFDGATSLRSKLPLIIQDQIRHLRRALAGSVTHAPGKAKSSR